MKKIVVAVVVVCSLLALCGGSATAMMISGPSGQQLNGWFKDGFTEAIAHGNPPTCIGAGIFYHYAYTGTDPGTHTYAFYADNFDNPYVQIDGGSFVPLDMRCSTGTITGPPSQLIGQFTASVDSQPPFVSITSPSGPVSTSASSYTVSGFAGDPEGNLQSVQAVINGASGPSASLSGGTFSVTIPLSSGANTVQMVANDIVGHSSTSNSVVITRTSGSGGTTGGGSTGGGSSSSSGGSTTSSSGSSANSSSITSSSPTSQTQAVKFNQQQVLNILNPNGSTSEPSDVQANDSLSGATGKTYSFLISTIIILVLLCGFVLWRFRPIFAELDRDRSGLRRRVIAIVTIPSLIPLLGLGFLGYQQLSSSVKSQLSGQLEKAAQTSALKLDREFAIRQTIVTKTASDILQIQSQYQTQQNQLTQEKSGCSAVVSSDIPRSRNSDVINNSDCLPFLTGFAQLAGSSGNVSSYLAALNQGATQAQQDLTAQENQRVNELLGSLRFYFPDVLEVDIVGADGSGNIVATLPRFDSKQPSIGQTHKQLLKQAASSNLALFDSLTKPRELVLTYPISSGKQLLGGAVVAISTDASSFIPAVWSATPKPYVADQVYFVTTANELITPETADKHLANQIHALAQTPANKVYNLKLSGQVLATRTSPVANTNWVVAVGAPANSILAPLAGIQRTALIAITGFLLLSAVLGIWFVSSIAEEIERLFKGALAFAKGQLDYRIGLKSHDELQVLGETMDKMAADIKTAQDALIEKDKEFINVATHELKAPMTSIIGNLSMVTEEGMGQMDDTARKLIDQAFTGTIRLRDIVTDMLDIARLESGHAEFKPEALDIRKLTQATVDLQSVPAQQASVSLNYQPTEPTPPVIADKSKLQVILSNFVSNAIKYNRPGGTITISHRLDGDKLVTAVADTGLGIPEDQKTHMFEKFYRVQHDDRINVPGTGLGLHITKRFIEAMGGQVWFDSIHGKGTTFYFSLPLAEQATPDAGSAKATHKL